MPYFYDLNFINHVRKDLSSQTRIITISSAGNEENVLRTFELAVNYFISKLVSPLALLVRIAREVNKKQI